MGGLRVGDGIAIDYPGAAPVGPPPALAYRGAAGASTATATDTVTLTVPAVQAGDLMLLFGASSRPRSDLLDEDYAGAGNGVTISTSNSAWDAVQGSPTFDTSWSPTGTGSGLYAAAGSSVYTTRQVTATSTGSASWYVKIGTLAGTRAYLMNVQSSATIRAQVGIDPDGTILIRNGTTLVAQATVGLAAGEYRIEWQATGATQSARAYALHGTTPIAGTSISGAYSGSTWDRLLFGVTASNTLTVNVAGARISSAAEWIGPVVTTPATPTGWTLRSAITPLVKGSVLRAYAWSRIAQPGDAGSSLPLVWSAALPHRKALQVVAYSNAHPSSAVNAEAGAVETTAGTSHATPTVTVTAAGTWVVEWCADQGNPGSTDLTAPAGFTERNQQLSTGSGGMTSSVADTAATVATGTRGGDTWAGTVSTANAATMTFAVAPATA